MRNLVKTYSYIAGSRTITLDVENDFTIEDIRLIYNETQKVLLCATANKDLVASIVDKSITFVNTLPILVAGDKITIEIDKGEVPTETLVNEMNVDRSIICKAVRDKGQYVNDTDNSVLVASKIRAISSSINVKSTPGIPPDWHDIVEAVASVNDISVQYKYALLIPKAVTRVYLQGANRFDMSDGVSTTNTGIYEFDTTKDDLPATKAFYEGEMAWMTDTVRIEANMTGYTGNVALTIPIGTTINQAIADHNNSVELNKRLTLISGNGDVSPTNGTSVIAINGGYQGNAGFSTRWIVFSSSSPNPVQSFAVSIGDPAFSWVRKILQVFIYNVSIQGLNFDGCYITNITFDDSYRLTNGADDPANNTFKFVQQPNQFRNNYIQNFRFPNVSESIQQSDKNMDINQTNVFNSAFINQIIFPAGLQNLTMSGGSAFAGCPALTQLLFPAGLQNLTISGGYAFTSCVALTQIFFPAGLQNLTISGGSAFQNCPALTQLLFPAGLQNLTISGGSAFQNCPALTQLFFPAGLQNLTISGLYVFVNCTALTQIIFPAGLQNLTISASQTFAGCSALTQLLFPAGLQNLTISASQLFLNSTALNYIYFSKPTTTFLGMTVDALTGIVIPIKIELENRWNFSINFSSATNPNLNAAEMETFIIDRLLDLRSTAQENVFVNIDAGALTTWNAVKSDGSPLVGHANFLEIFRVNQVVIVNIAGTNRSYTIADIPSNNKLIMTSSSSMVAGTYELNYNKIATFGATNLAKLSVAQKAKATTKEWQLA